MWFILTCASAVLWSITNFIDKLVLSRLHVNTGASTIILFSSVLAWVSLPFIILFAPGIHLQFSFATLVLCVTGVLYAVGLYCYCLALRYEDTSIIVPFFQLSPLLAIVLAFIFLHQALTIPQLVAAVIVLLGGLLLSIDMDAGFRFRKEVVMYMTICALCFAIGAVLFLTIATEDTFWSSWLWEQVGLAVFGLVLLCVPRFRKDFFGVIRSSQKSFLALNGVNEVITLAGNGSIRFASLLAPLGIVSVVANAIQPIIVFVLGIILTLTIPHIINEKIQKKHLVQKIMAIIIMSVGTYYLR